MKFKVISSPPAYQIREGWYVSVEILANEFLMYSSHDPTLIEIWREISNKFPLVRVYQSGNLDSMIKKLYVPERFVTKLNKLKLLDEHDMWFFTRESYWCEHIDPNDVNGLLQQISNRLQRKDLLTLKDLRDGYLD